MLAEHFLTMYPNLNMDTDSELEQLKVRTGRHVEPGYTDRITIFLTRLLGIDVVTTALFRGRHFDM